MAKKHTLTALANMISGLREPEATDGCKIPTLHGKCEHGKPSAVDSWLKTRHNQVVKQRHRDATKPSEVRYK